MSVLAVFAHFDPGGAVGPHVERYLAELATVVDRLVVVSTADLDPTGRKALAKHGELLERENVGYDFLSWKHGFDHVGSWADFDRVVMCNDSVVGPFRPLARVLGAMDPARVDFWGLVDSIEIAPHLQSWFVVFERPVLCSGFLHGFWRAMTPESDRYWVIRRYEIGLSRLLLTAGFRMGAYFRPTPADRLRARVRYARWVRSLPSRVPGRDLPPWREPWPWNPMHGCWEAAVDGRLPFAKVEVLRDGPYGGDRETMLTRLERAHPEAMAGVRAYLERTRADYARLR